VKNPSETLLLGAHTSTAGGVHHALLHGKDIGATTIQLFTANQRQWKSKPLTEEGILLFQEALQSTGISHVMSHASYLINLGSPNLEILAKSREAFSQEIERCLQLGLTFLNFHPGAALEASREECLDLIVDSLLATEKQLSQGKLRLLLEATAGQGSSIGATFEELEYILKKVGTKLPLGVCIDTCHIFAAGYDVRTPQAWENTLQQFDRVVGLNHLYAFHLNDSMKPLGSKKDRRANLGEGEIGMECFKYLMQDPVLRALPKYLETPGGMPTWNKEIAILRTL
jgi:deoxyribonuclease-4